MHILTLSFWMAITTGDAKQLVLNDDTLQEKVVNSRLQGLLERRRETTKRTVS